jgi:DNA-binding beta-propeller fold protein YncE
MRHPVKRSAALVTLVVLAAACRPTPPVHQQTAAAQVTSSSIANVGLETPESVLYDGLDDVYLVSNINGQPLDKDGNGFISRLAPDGRVLQLKWIAGGAEGVTLNAPKGMGLKGDTLFVADIDAVRLFNRTTGAPLGARPVRGATFLNDLAVGPDGTVYVTDSGLKAGPQGFLPTGTDAVYRFDAAGRAEAVARDTALEHPNGVLAEAGKLTVVAFGSNAVYELDPASGKRSDLPRPTTGSLDGIVRLPDGALLVSSWEGQCVYRSTATGYTVVADSVESPADIGYDTSRHLLLIPIFDKNRIEIRQVQ